MASCVFTDSAGEAPLFESQTHSRADSDTQQLLPEPAGGETDRGAPALGGHVQKSLSLSDDAIMTEFRRELRIDMEAALRARNEELKKHVNTWMVRQERALDEVTEGLGTLRHSITIRASGGYEEATENHASHVSLASHASSASSQCPPPQAAPRTILRSARPTNELISQYKKRATPSWSMFSHASHAVKQAGSTFPVRFGKSSTSMETKPSSPTFSAREESRKLSEISSYSKDEELKIQRARTVQLSNAVSRPTVFSSDFISPNSWRSGCLQCHYGAHHRVLTLVRGAPFGYITAFAIMVNAILMGVEVGQRDTELGKLLALVQLLLNIGFLIELLLRLYALGSKFLLGADAVWNCLDGILVSMFLLEVVAVANGASKTGGGMSNVMMIRMVRIIRVVRVLRVIRLMRFFRPLRMLIRSIFETLKSLVYAMMLLAIIMYAFGVVFTQAAVDHAYDDLVTNPIHLEMFGSVLRSMLTLFKCITAGMNWEHANECLWDIGGFYSMMFQVYIIFALFAVLNVMTGQFCQGAIETAKRDDDEVICEQLNAKNSYIKKLVQLFTNLTAGSKHAYITLEDFELNMKNRRVQAYFQALDIEINDAWTVFKMLNQSGTNLVSMDEFVTGCLELRGSASKVTLKELVLEYRWFSKRFDAKLTGVEKRQIAMEARQIAIESALLQHRPAAAPASEACPQPEATPPQSARSDVPI